MENRPTPSVVKTNLDSIRKKETEELAEALRGLQKKNTPAKKPQDRKSKRPDTPRHLTDRPFAKNEGMAALQAKMQDSVVKHGGKPFNNSKPRRTNRPRGKA